MYIISELVSIAITHHCKGNISEANKMYRRILSLDPNNLMALNNLGLISLPSEKIDLLSRALTLNSEYTDAHFNLAIALEQQNRSADAMEHYAKILQILDNLISQGKFEECIHILKLLLQRFPGNEAVIRSIANAYINLGASHQKQGQFELAIDSFSQALNYDCKNHIAHENIIFTQNFIEGMDIASQQQERSRWNEAYARHFQQTEYWRSNTHRKIRVGYISGNFKSYAATYAFAPLIFNHNSDQFEVVCYADQQGGDSLTELLMAKATLWREVANKSDEQIAKLIVDDRIDILVDCAGFQKGNRLLVFARKPAPIQVTGWGEPTGPGLPAMDYLLADPVLIPACERHLFTEKIVDLPCFLGYWMADPLPEPGPLPLIHNGYVTFGSFNRGAKHTDTTLALWAKTLNSVPNSNLLLKAPEWGSLEKRTRLLDRFASYGGDPERVRFLGYIPRNDHFIAYQQVDICLDPQPHSGGMTTLDALHMGIPVLTLPGATPSSRLAAAVLSALGLTDWIAKNSADFVAKAIAFTAAIPSLGELRHQLRSRITSSSFGNPVIYAKMVEEQYLNMWQQWCSNRNNPDQSQ